MLNKSAIVQQYSQMRISNNLSKNMSKNLSHSNKSFPKGQSKGLGAILLVFALSLISGCASTYSQPGAKDSFEATNRAILNFNLASDRMVLKPVAKAYARVMPKPLRNSVANFTANLWQPMNVLNDVLQGKLGYALHDTYRFVINTTAGILGLFDVAAEFGLAKHREDFGQTLAVWGVPPGPYLMLPFLGPSNLRDAIGLFPQFAYADSVDHFRSPQRTYLRTIRIVNTRAQLLGIDNILDVQPDKYIFLRENYRQQRRDLIHDGNPPKAQDDLEDLLIESLDDN